MVAGLCEDGFFCIFRFPFFFEFELDSCRFDPPAAVRKNRTRISRRFRFLNTEFEFSFPEGNRFQTPFFKLASLLPEVVSVILVFSFLPAR